jgi:hypothetical protein
LRSKEVARTMAHGTSRGMRSYVNKVFDIEAKLTALADPRCEPDVPQAAVLSTWFWALCKRLPSTEQVGDMLKDKRWRARLGLKDGDGGSPDTAGRVLDGLLVDEVNELALEGFFAARRAGILKDDGPYGLRCAIVDMNELFKSEKVHCSACMVRKKTVGEGADKREVVLEYYHQAVALVWASGEIAWPMGWELLKPGEGELPAALRLLARLLPRLSKSIDIVLGDALYCCRPYFRLVHDHGLDGLAISSGVTEMDEEIALTMRTVAPVVGANKVAHWSHESEAWQRDVGCKLRVIHHENRSATSVKAYRHERKQMRIVTTAEVAVLPDGQGWQVGRCRWHIEDGTFNVLTKDYSLEHNYRHSTTAILMLLVLRALAYCLTKAYWRYATARAKTGPRCFLAWWQDVLGDDWVRYLDAALTEAPAPNGSG